MNRSYRLVSAIVVVLLITAGSASATLTRVRALGGGLSYVDDDAGATLWYTSLLDYPDRAVLDIGDVNLDHGGNGLGNSGGGIHLALDHPHERTCIGLYLQDTLPAEAPGGAITLLGAHRFGALALGFKAGFTSYFAGENSTETYGYGRGIYFHDYGLAGRWDASPSVSGDLAFDLVNVQGDAGEEDLWYLPYQQNWSTWGVRTRWFVRVSDEVVLVPLIDHRHDDRPAASVTIGAPADRHAYRNAFGVGFQVQTDEANLILISGEYRRIRERESRILGESTSWLFDRTDLTAHEVTARVGIESTVRPWLVLRGSLQYLRLQNERLSARGHTLPDVPDRWAQSRSIMVYTPVTIGVGLALAPFTADVTLNTRWRETYGAFPFTVTPAPAGTYTAITVGYLF